MANKLRHGKMKIKEFQEALAKESNALDELVQGGCKAFATALPHPTTGCRKEEG